MLTLLKNSEKKFKKSDNIPSLMRGCDIKVSERLLIRKPLKPVDRENFNVRKLEKLMNMQMMKEFKQQATRCNTQSQARLKIQDKKLLTFYSNHLDKISPLSCLIKQNRTRSNVLEKVIDGRKTLNFNSISQKDLFL